MQFAWDYIYQWKIVKPLLIFPMISVAINYICFHKWYHIRSTEYKVGQKREKCAKSLAKKLVISIQEKYEMLIVFDSPQKHAGLFPD